MNTNQSTESVSKIKNNTQKTKTADIVKATLEGSKCLRNVVVTKIEEKRINVKECFKQKYTRLRFLPLNKLKILSIASSLKPNKVLTDDMFYPVGVSQDCEKYWTIQSASKDSNALQNKF